MGLACDIAGTLTWVDLIRGPDWIDSQNDSMLSSKVSTQGMGQNFRWSRQPYLQAGRISYELGVRRFCVSGGLCQIFGGLGLGFCVSRELAVVP